MSEELEKQNAKFGYKAPESVYKKHDPAASKIASGTFVARSFGARCLFPSLLFLCRSMVRVSVTVGRPWPCTFRSLSPSLSPLTYGRPWRRIASHAFSYVLCCF